MNGPAEPSACTSKACCGWPSHRQGMSGVIVISAWLKGMADRKSASVRRCFMVKRLTMVRWLFLFPGGYLLSRMSAIFNRFSFRWETPRMELAMMRRQAAFSELLMESMVMYLKLE